jgi:hypothetical protein
MNCEIKINRITIETPFLLYANLDTKYIVNSVSHSYNPLS